MSDTMRAIEISEPGGPEVLRPTTRPVPEPMAEQILIAVDHAGVNRPDALQRAGSYAPPPGASDLPGLEAAGVVARVGPGVTRWKEGRRGLRASARGRLCRIRAHPPGSCPAGPEGHGHGEAAALCETFFTVWTNVFMRGGLQAGERFLVHGGSSGIGTTAIQLARHFGARVFATAGSAEKCAACVELGAERAINYREEDFVEILRAEGGANLILDMVGGPYLPRNVKALADEGRLVQIAFLQGPKVEN
jgi:NADPH2:quinone reductase